MKELERRTKEELTKIIRFWPRFLGRLIAAIFMFPFIGPLVIVFFEDIDED
jgi:hypothetical protein